jgi:hypothetical protein
MKAPQRALPHRKGQERQAQRKLILDQVIDIAKGNA